MIKVINAANTTAYDTIDGMSCIDYWRRACPRADSSFCRAKHEQGTEDDIIVGGHVISVDNLEPHVFITPILRSVNNDEYYPPFDVSCVDLVRVPLEMERAILSDPDNHMNIKKAQFNWLTC